MGQFENERINDMLNKMWSGDMFTLTNTEIHNIIKNSMWQTFLVDAYDISVKTNFSDGVVKIEIEGEMLMDMANIINGIEIFDDGVEVIDFTMFSDEDDDDEENDEDDD